MALNTYSYDSLRTPSAPVITIEVQSPNGQFMTLRALVDSGADATILPAKILNQLRAPYVKSQYLRTGDERRLLINLYAVAIRIADFTLPFVRVVSMPNSDEAVVGRDVLNHLIVTLNGIEGITEIS